MPDSKPPPIAEDEIFQAAAALPTSERAAYLDAACAGQPKLRAGVARLLAAVDDGGFMQRPMDRTVSPDLEEQFARLKPEEAGERIGPYKLLQQIGEGGFGTVWMAEQEQPVRRRVALKIIKLGMDTKEVIARFEQERQALAMMDHPNIARVFDAGATQYGRPFFVMELVRGVRITDYCDEQQLSTDERIALFVHVCQAVQHAHQKGIIHRDLKPSNILVTINDGEPVPKVIDFGVAKATQGRLTDATLFTQFEQMVGTPLYMSPEQAELTSLDIDTRSDIYSLGVLLYELLTGRTPIDTGTMAQAGMDEIRRLIREVDPPRPSARVKTLDGNELTTAAKRRHTDSAKLPGTLRGDLDWIVMKCLEKDRKRRYDTANGLALDLKRHLANEVIIARPPTAGYLLSRLLRRHKLAFAASAAIAAALLIGITVSVWQAMLAKREAGRANAALEELRATAPAFAEQARGLIARERFDEAIEKLDYAIKLRPDVTDYALTKADLLQCQLRFAEAATVYRAVLDRAPEHARARANAALCDRLQADLSAQSKLSRESLVQLLVAMAGERRSAAEMLPVGRLAGEEKKLVLDVWLARLKDLPVPPKIPLKERLTMNNDGLLVLDLSGTFVTDLSPLEGMPLASLNLGQCGEVADLRPLSRLPLQSLDLRFTNVTDLAPLASVRTLTTLNLMNLKVRDISALRGLPLTEIILNGTQVSDLLPLHGMPLQSISLGAAPVSDLTPLAGLPLRVFEGTAIPASDFSPLAGVPLEFASFQSTRIGDLAFLRGMPLKLLALNGCEKARGFGVIAEIKTLETLVLPANPAILPAEELAAIAALRRHPALRHIEFGLEMNMVDWVTTQSADDFWKRWDRETAWILGLHEAGVKFTVSRRNDGTLALVIDDAAFSDLSVIKGANIGSLDLGRTAVTDLTPLAGMPLASLHLNHTPVSDLTPLGDMALKKLSLRETKVTDLAVLRRAPLCMSLEGLWLYRTKVTDFTPVEACTALTVFDATDTGIADLAPLRGRKLREIYFASGRVRDISVLAGMPLERIFFDQTPVADVTPLLQCPQLRDVILPKTAQNVTALRQLPKLARVSYSFDGKKSGPSLSAEEFWLENEDDDAGNPPAK